MMHFVPFRAEHLAEIGAVREACSLGDPAQLAEAAVALERGGWAWTGRAGARTYGCGGIFWLGHGRGYAWAMLAVNTPLRAFPIIGRQVVHVLEQAHDAGLERIETYVLMDFAPGVRWALRLGFANPFPMRKFNAGRDYWMMERVR